MAAQVALRRYAPLYFIKHKIYFRKYSCVFFFPLLNRQQINIHTNKTTTTMMNSNKYRNSALFIQQKRLAIQKNLQQLQKSSITRDVIRSKLFIFISCFCLISFEKIVKHKVIKLKIIVSTH